MGEPGAYDGDALDANSFDGSEVGTVEGVNEGMAVAVTVGLAEGAGDCRLVGEPGSVDGVADGRKLGPVGVSVITDGLTEG